MARHKFPDCMERFKTVGETFPEWPTRGWLVCRSQALTNWSYVTRHGRKSVTSHSWNWSRVATFAESHRRDIRASRVAREWLVSDIGSTCELWPITWLRHPAVYNLIEVVLGKFSVLLFIPETMAKTKKNLKKGVNTPEDGDPESNPQPPKTITGKRKKRGRSGQHRTPLQNLDAGKEQQEEGLAHQEGSVAQLEGDQAQQEGEREQLEDPQIEQPQVEGPGSQAVANPPSPRSPTPPAEDQEEANAVPVSLNKII